ncbi:hypothetical protein [Haliscomenobacter hydrossis]|uniref:Uncharacterized protein n=1 Tax=Haliscomenobacter hydrossis (strain ATCC 27775 / DSM 1100 / LMG 10767 / O) TaxID=760192 RepID=F4L7M2_HALH1|nr:hypothetical protein [Haliscomenobacter hydrossis]AEE54380.1 hypothetical protein Halhy_6564 [Haliscomenobacter hydrossis DSM 1100]
MTKSISATPYVLEVAQQAQLPIDQTLLEGHLELGQKPLDPSDKERGVDIEQYSDGSLKASSFKVYNLLHFSQNNFRLSLLKILPAAAGVVMGSAILTTILALLGFLQAFLESSKKEFHEQDAKVLLTIYKLGSMCHLSTIPAEYQLLFNASISEDALRASINLLAQYRTVRLYNNGEVEIKESVQLSRQ